MLPYTFGLCKEEGAASEVPDPSPALCSQSQPAAQPSPAFCRRRGQKGQRTCSATLPRLPARKTIQKPVSHHKEMSHQWTRRCWEQQAPFASALPLLHCSLCSSQTMLCSHNPLPGWLTHMAPHSKELKTSLKHLCDHESCGSDTLQPHSPQSDSGGRST